MFGLEIEMAPVAKERPRLTMKGHAYTPRKTKVAEEQIRSCLIANNAPLLEGPLDLSIVFHVKKPKKPKDYFPIVRPDLDNYLKTFMDASNGVLYLDDAAIVSVRMLKVYSEIPKIVFVIKKYAPVG